MPLPIKFIINDAKQNGDQKILLLSATLGTISVQQQFVINDTLDRTAIITTMRDLLNAQIRINNQFNNLQSRIGQDF